jgi:hypothetical protein
MSVEKLIFELTVGAVGYEVRKVYGEELAKYVFRPAWNKLKAIVPIYERKVAIWAHHKYDHATSSLLDCREGKCSII